MSEQRSALPREELEPLDEPVLFYAGGSGSIWHLPQIDGDSMVPGCHATALSRLRVTEMWKFQRRRNPRLCKQCIERLDLDGEPEEYPEAAPYGGSNG